VADIVGRRAVQDSAAGDDAEAEDTEVVEAANG